jgi:methylase of polypeptide subunit release factors
MAVIVHSGRMPEVTRAPPGLRGGLDRWIEGASDYPTGTPLLVPLRKILRIASDIKRLEEGIHVPALGASIAVLPTVFAPVDGKVTELFAGHAEIEPGSRVLDVGTGTGVLALIAARRGAAVTAVDRNPQAVCNARLNARRLGLEAGMSFPDPADLFGSLGEARFEAILFNAPWLSGTPRTAYEAALYDDGSVISRFLEGAPAHLAPGGAIWLLYADVFERTGHGALSILRELLAKNGLQVRNRWGTKRTGRVSGRAETVVLYEIRRSQTEV